MFRTCNVILVRLITFALLSMSYHVLKAKGSIPFFQGDLESFRQATAQQHRPYMIYFGLSDHYECQQLENHSFQHESLIDLISQKLLIYHVDAREGQYAQALIQHYRVQGFPTILVFGLDDQLLGQFFGFVSGEDLYQGLTEFLSTQQHAPSFVQQKATAAETNATESLPQISFSESLKSYDPALRTEKANFGIKVGYFTNVDLLEWEVQKYERFWRGDIFTLKQVVRGKDYYMLILGGYESPQEAYAYAVPMRQIAAIETEIIEFRDLLSRL